ncbi:hypothetical protein HQ496_11120, partial [bacterium]|nr:hypothetical protein [bacterium]
MNLNLNLEGGSVVHDSSDEVNSLAFLLKSYSGDFGFARRLVESFNAFNSESIRLFCVIPDGDQDLFSALSGNNVTVLSEKNLSPYFTQESVHGLRSGYINQEIVKLSFWELGLCSNYFCVDSDAVFVRPFGVSDFMFNSQTPYTILVEDNELQVEPSYFANHWQGRQEAIRRIMREVDLDDPVMRTCHGHQVFSAAVLQSFKEDFLNPR